MLAIAPFLCLTLGAGLKKDETALVPVALEREGGRQRSGRQDATVSAVLPVQQEVVVGLEFDLEPLFRQKQLWVYLGQPSSTLYIGSGMMPDGRSRRPGLPPSFQIEATGTGRNEGQSHVFLVQMWEGDPERGTDVAGYRVSYAACAAFSTQTVHPTYSYTSLAKVDPSCPVNVASLLFTAVAAVAMNLKSKNLKLQDHAQFPQCKEPVEGVFQSPAYIIMYGTTFYEYKAAKLFGKARMTLMGEVKVESRQISLINRLKRKWTKSNTRGRTTLKPTEARGLKQMCVSYLPPDQRPRCDRIYNGRTSANVYKVHRCPAGPTRDRARAQLLLMSRYVAPPWQMVRALRARIYHGDGEIPRSWKLNPREMELSRLIPSVDLACSAMSTIYRNHAPLPQGLDARRALEVTVPLP